MPALLFHRHFQALIDRLLLQMEQQAMQLVNALTAPLATHEVS
jgi:hypothetical protein